MLEVLRVPPRARTSATDVGSGVVAGSDVFDTRFQVYAFTSAKPIVLLNPSAKAPGLLPPFTLLVYGMAPFPPSPVLGSHTIHVPTLAEYVFGQRLMPVEVVDSFILSFNSLGQT